MAHQLQPEFLSIAQVGSGAVVGSFAAPMDAASVPVVDARAWEEPEIRSLAARFEAPRSRVIAPWLRAVALVAPETPDELAVQLAQAGIVLISTATGENARHAVEGFLAELERMESMAGAAGFQGGTQATGAAGASSSASGVAGGAAGSPYSHTPAQFDQATYKAWLDRLEQPWRDEDARDTDV